MHHRGQFPMGTKNRVRTGSWVGDLTTRLLFYRKFSGCCFFLLPFCFFIFFLFSSMMWVCWESAAQQKLKLIVPLLRLIYLSHVQSPLVETKWLKWMVLEIGLIVLYYFILIFGQTLKQAQVVQGRSKVKKKKKKKI